tara:strand:+ start:39869 stop:40837 length:969 start_codon:yes stop_codon:yes gene_type:complete
MKNTYILKESSLVVNSIFSIIGIFLFIYSPITLSKTYQLNEQSNIVGMVKIITSKWGDTLPTVGRRHSMGGEEMEDANPAVDYWQPKVGSRIVIPSRYILPDASQKGIVINIAEMRLYYYHPKNNTVTTFPVAIGKEGWRTPIGKTKIIRMRENPTWVVPESIIADRRKNNMKVFKTMPPGPKNPLGKYAMNLGFKNIVIHGTPWPLGVGLRTSHGCLRMMPEHIEQLYTMVGVGTEVNIVYQPSKVGYDARQVYLEVHENFNASMNQASLSLSDRFQAVASMLSKQTNINWKKNHNGIRLGYGYPMPVGRFYRQNSTLSQR